MNLTIWLVILTVAIALLFDLVNGFHDAANSIATIVSTRVLSPRYAVLWAAFFNFAAMFFFPPRVADTIAKMVHITAGEKAFIYVVLTGLLGAIVWDLLTWWWGLPTSSSHALIGGFAGAGIAHGGWGAVNWRNLEKTVQFIPLAPLIGFIMGFTIMVLVFWTFKRVRPASVDTVFRKLQFCSAAMYSLGHGANDAQKTMGIIVALLIAAGLLPDDVKLSMAHPKTLWIILSCQTAMALGTALGGWRIVRTMGMKIAKLKPVGGFCAETAGAFTLFLASHSGIPVSTTHTITGAIIGVGATTKLSGIKWGVATRIVWAWIITIPFSAIVAAGAFYVVRWLHPGI
ncbi:MAG: inorganic phosphate transporter [Candidatus Sumerlaeota bacterium]|nr:inorganic phosphate transporter [Candidatus Sumerlaeota bacterium]